MSEPRFRVIGIAGSLRAGSFNRALLQACIELAPDGTDLEVFDISELPLYNADLDRPQQPPAVAVALRAVITEADALLIVSPEHNWGPSAATKNVLDWASRPAGESVLRFKPVALQGASTGPHGTLRAQLQIRQYLQAQPAFVLPAPDVHVNQAATRFDESLRLTDEAIRGAVRGQLSALRNWAEALRAFPVPS